MKVLKTIGFGTYGMVFLEATTYLPLSEWIKLFIQAGVGIATIYKLLKESKQSKNNQNEKKDEKNN